MNDLANQITINVWHTAGTQYCCFAKDGWNVNKQIKMYLNVGNVVTLDFSGVAFTTSDFLWAMLAGIYNEYDERYVEEHLKATMLDSWKRHQLNATMKVSKDKARSGQDEHDRSILILPSCGRTQSEDLRNVS